MQRIEKSERGRGPEVSDADDVEKHEPAVCLPDMPPERAD
jgi:hypothetical protein